MHLFPLVAHVAYLDVMERPQLQTILQHLSRLIRVNMDLDHIIDSADDHASAILLEVVAQLGQTGGVATQHEFRAVDVSKIFIIGQHMTLQLCCGMWLRGELCPRSGGHQVIVSANAFASTTVNIRHFLRYGRDDRILRSLWSGFRQSVQASFDKDHQALAAGIHHAGPFQDRE